MTARPVPTVVVLVDGSNVAHRLQADSGIDIDDRKRDLVDLVCNWASSEHAVTITFDGAGPYGAGTRRVTPHVEVVGTGERDADSVLERRSRKLRRAGCSIWLVTDDVALRRVAGAGADRISSADDFLLLLRTGAPTPRDAERSHGPAAAGPGPVPRATRMTDGMAPDVRAALERIRRGTTEP
jgi:predicted RNA-binding protein with PIN domain